MIQVLIFRKYPDNYAPTSIRTKEEQNALPNSRGTHKIILVIFHMFSWFFVINVLHLRYENHDKNKGL